MTMSPPKVSVCIPTYKGEGTIAEAIESVLNQDFDDFEIIVIDDCSPGDTRALVERFHDGRVRYLRNDKNLGPEANWNRCISEARGEYFKLLPHDDLLHPTCLQRQVKVMDTDHDRSIGLVFSARTVVGPSGRVLMKRGYPGGTEGRIAAEDVIRACVRRGTNLIGEPGAVLMRRSLAERIGKFNATYPYVIDLDYWFRLLAHGDAWYCAEPLAGFRVSTQQWSVVIGTGQSEDFRRFLIEVDARGDLSAATVLDRLCGRVAPLVNNLARLLFYRLYLR